MAYIFIDNCPVEVLKNHDKPYIEDLCNEATLRFLRVFGHREVKNLYELRKLRKFQSDVVKKYFKL